MFESYHRWLSGRFCWCVSALLLAVYAGLKSKYSFHDLLLICVHKAVAGDRLQAAIAVMCSMLDENQRFDTYALIKPERLPTKLESEFNLRGKLRAAAYVIQPCSTPFDEGLFAVYVLQFMWIYDDSAHPCRYSKGGLDFEALFSQFDSDGSGELDLEEFG